MKLQKAFKFRLKILHGENLLLRQYAGCTRFVWNHFLAMQNERKANKLGLLSYVDMANMLPSLKEKYSFLKTDRIRNCSTASVRSEFSGILSLQ
jgi:putative transposase